MDCHRHNLVPGRLSRLGQSSTVSCDESSTVSCDVTKRDFPTLS